MGKSVVAVFRAKGHLIDSGLMSDALEAVQAAGASYRVLCETRGLHVAVEGPSTVWVAIY